MGHEMPGLRNTGFGQERSVAMFVIMLQQKKMLKTGTSHTQVGGHPYEYENTEHMTVGSTCATRVYNVLVTAEVRV